MLNDGDLHRAWQKQFALEWLDKVAAASGDEKALGAIYFAMIRAAIEKGECKKRLGLERHLRIVGRVNLMPDEGVMPN